LTKKVLYQPSNLIFMKDYFSSPGWKGIRNLFFALIDRVSLDTHSKKILDFSVSYTNEPEKMVISTNLKLTISDDYLSVYIGKYIESPPSYIYSLLQINGVNKITLCNKDIIIEKKEGFSFTSLESQILSIVRESDFFIETKNA